jgi:Calcineurin-like phosphoesterase
MLFEGDFLSSAGDCQTAHYEDSTKGMHMPRSAKTPLAAPVFGEPVFNEGVPTPDPTQFKIPEPSDSKLYKQIQTLLTKDTVSFPASSGKPGDLYELQDAWGPHGAEIIQNIQKAKQISFHTLGDTGASEAQKYANAIRVSDMVTNDFHTSDPANPPAFLYHLGDVVYDFGESEYYYDQFYEPYRNYPAPILAIPGNHDSFIVPGTAVAQQPLKIFMRNFCASGPTVTTEAGPLHRTAMTQPGVYFTLDAPFVRVIGLFSNALEDPGLISSESGKWKAVPDVQLAFLTAQLRRIKSDNFQGAVLLATHHPAFTYAPPQGGKGGGGTHSSSNPMLREIDTICKAQGVYPHAFLSGHAHNYQHYTRSVNFNGKKFDVPFIICGDSGHNVDTLVQAKKGQPAQEPAQGANVTYLDANPVVQATGLKLEKYDDKNYGYLRITVNAQQLRIDFHPAVPGGGAATDTTIIDLSTHTKAA